MALVGCGGETVSGQPALTAQGSESGDESTSGGETGGATKADTVDGETSGAETSTSSGSTSTSESGEGSDESSGGPPQSCGVVSMEGMCGPVTDCGSGSNAFGGGLCDGPPTAQCCVPVDPRPAIEQQHHAILKAGPGIGSAFFCLIGRGSPNWVAVYGKY